MGERLRVLIPAYERRDALLGCLESLERSEGGMPPVLVVDDASRDDSVAAVRARFPSCALRVNARNLGFAATCNAGFEQLLAEGPEQVLLLNQDTRVAADTVATLARFLDEHPRAAVVGPKTWSFDPAPDGRPRLIWAGSWQRRLPLLQRIPGIGAPEQVPLLEPRRTDFVWGHGMMIRAAALREVGGFDPAFPMYYEDLDLCRRLRAAGYELWCEPRALLWHDQPDGARALRPEAWRWACKVRSTGVFHRKHYGALASLALTPLTLAEELRQLLFQGHLRAAGQLARAAVRRGLRLPDELRPPAPPVERKRLEEAR